MSYLFNTFLYQPILNLLILIYNIIPIKDMGIAIILLTILIKLALWPLSRKTLEAQKKMKDLQPKMQEINQKYKDDPTTKAKEIMKLYKENKANPASSCLPLLIQLPILWAIFKVFQNSLKTGALANLYSFVHQPEIVNKFLFSIQYFDLSKPNWTLTILAAVAQFWQSKMMSTQQPAVINPGSKDEGIQAMLNKQMLYMMPLMTLLIGFKLPGGLMLYWLVSTLLAGFQQWWQFRAIKN